MLLRRRAGPGTTQYMLIGADAQGAEHPKRLDRSAHSTVFIGQAFHTVVTDVEVALGSAGLEIARASAPSSNCRHACWRRGGSALPTGASQL